MLKRIVLGLFLTLTLIFLILELRNLSSGTPYDKSISMGYLTALIYTIVFGFLLQKTLSSAFANSNKVLTFVALGLTGAVIVETSIWAAQNVFKASGASINDILAVDLLMTLPFYGFLTYLFAKVAIKSQHKPSLLSVLVLGGIYELFADGVFGSLLKNSLLGVLLSPLMLPVFVVIYAPIILVPYIVTFNPKDRWANFNLEVIFLKPVFAVLVLPFSIMLGLFIRRVLG